MAIMEEGRPSKACEKAGGAVEDKLRETMVSILRARGPSKTWSVREKKKKKKKTAAESPQHLASRSLTITTTDSPQKLTFGDPS